MGNFPESIHFDFGIYVRHLVEWMTTNWEPFFNGIKIGILSFLTAIQAFLLWIPWFVVLLIVFLISWKVKGLKSGFTYAFLIFLVGVMGLWDEMMMTLAVVVTSVIISIILGLPLGILAAYNRRAELILKPILDAMQTMPSFVYLIPAVMFFGLGLVPAVFATIIYATPPLIRLTDLAIRRVSNEMLEAAHSFGSTPWQTLIKVELPQAFPTIMAGINQTTMMAMSMVVISSMIGTKGLGINVVTAINRIDIGMGFQAGISIVFLAIIIDRVTQQIGKKFEFSK